MLTVYFFPIPLLVRDASLAAEADESFFLVMFLQIVCVCFHSGAYSSPCRC